MILKWTYTQYTEKWGYYSCSALKLNRKQCVRTALDGDSCSNFTAIYLGNKATAKKIGNAKVACFDGCQKYDNI